MHTAVSGDIHPTDVGFISNALNSADIWTSKPHLFCGILEHVEVLFWLAMSVNICLHMEGLQQSHSLVKDNRNIELHVTRRENGVNNSLRNRTLKPRLLCIRALFTLYFRFARHFSIVCEEEKILSVYMIICLHLINSMKSCYTNDNFSRLMKIRNKSVPAKISLSFCYCNKNQ